MDTINEMRILQAAHELFYTRGYRSATIKDLADKLGMSKKTIYQYFSSKEEIATAVVYETMKKIGELMDKSEFTQSNPLIVLRENFINSKDEFLRFSPLFLMDIEKYLPLLAVKYKQFREERKKVIEDLLISAKEIGLIKDIHIHLAMEILHESLRALTKPEFLSAQIYSRTDVVDTFIDIFFSGIAAPKTIEPSAVL